MRARIALILSLIFTSVSALSIMAGAGMADEHPTYGWETCEEGWTVGDEGMAPTGLAEWTRGEPGQDSDISFQTGQYSQLQEATLTSPPYSFEGGELTVDFAIAHDVEPAGDETIFDHVAVEWSVDEGDWTVEAQYAGQNEGYPEFIEESITIEPPAGELLIRFRLHSDELLSSVEEGYEGAFVDNVTIPLSRPEGTGCEEEADPSASPTDGEPSPDPTDDDDDDDDGDGGSDCTITGTRYGDHIDGTDGDDVICARGGNDVIRGLGGNDVIRGGRGDDVLRGGPGDDTIRGGRGDDKIRGGSGEDTCKGGKGNDKLRGCE